MGPDGEKKRVINVGNRHIGQDGEASRKTPQRN